MRGCLPELSDANSNFPLSTIEGGRKTVVVGPQKTGGFQMTVVVGSQGVYTFFSRIRKVVEDFVRDSPLASDP